MDRFCFSFLFSIPISFREFSKIFLSSQIGATHQTLFTSMQSCCQCTATYTAAPIPLKNYGLSKKLTRKCIFMTRFHSSPYTSATYMNLEKSRCCLTKIQSTACHPLDQIEKMKLFLAFFFVLFLAIIVVRIRFLNRRQLYHTIVARDIISFLFSLNDTMQSIIKY